MLEPIYRIEFFLDAIVNNTTPPEPIYRVEFYLAKIAGADVEIPEPVYRMEKYLAYLCGEEVELPDPIYRIEYYLAFLCGLNVELPEPIYRVEFWLWDWCGGGGIEKTVTGNPIHILDALAKPAQALSVKLEPIQDLHGYGNPWPAGGGKNMLHVTATSTTAADVTMTVTADGTIALSGTANALFNEQLGSIYLEAGTEYYISGTPSGGGGATYDMRVRDASYNVLAQDNGSGNPFTPTTSGTYYVALVVRSGVNVTGKVFKPMICLSSAQNPTVFAPYSNICPISGHTDADVTRTGKNLIDKSDFEQTGDFVWGYRNVGFALKSGITYTLSSNFDFDSMRFVSVDEQTVYANKTSPNTLRYTPSEDVLVVIRLWHSSSFDYSSITIQLELGSTATDYAPFVGTTYPIPLGQTVYGGTLDVLTGVLTIDTAYYQNKWKNGDSDSVLGDFTRKRFTAPSLSKYPSFTHTPLCNVAPYLANFQSDSLHFYVNDSVRNNVLVFLPNNTDGETDIEVCYELATPQTIQLAPTQVELLLGENNIWSDGEMTLVYLADGNASEIEALNILLGGRYVNNHEADEPTDREALDIVLGGQR